ncbi:winged helix-turn-helix domain-containing protein [Oscillospiraceae bacterium OttesenSCG-928-G22]|nr:winged helix-turn-helix domain-containing protein [Oscillospiraceae bacterium OttesenSCG-928-G22]
MNGWILVIDPNTENHPRAKTDWAEHQVAVKIAASMEQAFAMLSDEDYLLIAVIADNFEYLPRLKELVEAAPVPIIVLTTNYNHTERLAASRAGAIAYLGDMVFETAVPCVWFLLCQLQQPRSKPVEALRISTHRNILLCEQCHAVFVGGAKLTLSHKEFSFLEYLLVHAGRVMGYTQIFEYVWQSEDTGQARKFVSNLASRLRRSLNHATDAEALISTVWEIGYRIDIY